MEIERKFLIENPPADYASFPFRRIEQAYLCTEPVIRIRREDDSYYMTYKGSGLLSREEYNLPLTADAYAHLLPKADGTILTKKRYLLPLSDSGLTIELDVFEGRFAGLILAEVEFPTEEAARAFTPPEWFAKDVTLSGEYQNSRLSRI
ncbi:MAG: CYTH domain-containing protein [Lachnospiraceae bacterium]|jgi:adenylate cyclase|nr:CYTH domain-containing protein [Lachnospiraceae bacterium]